MGPNLHRGEIWWADIPGDRVRPVLVVTRDRFIPLLSRVMVAPVTTRVRGIPTEVELSVKDGLPHACAANFDNVFTLNIDRFSERISSLNPSKLDEVCRAFRFAAGC